jgi:uncharacterized protein
MTVQTVAGLLCGYAFAGFVQGLTGFAYGLILVPLLSLFFATPAEAVGMTAVTALFQVAFNYWLHRRRVEHRRIFLLGLVAVACIPVGAAVLYAVPEGAVFAILGATIVFITLSGIVFSGESRGFLSSKPVGYGLTAVSGLVAGAFSTPGPVIAGYLFATDSDRLRAKANTQFFYVVVTGVIVAAHAVGGGVNPSSLSRSLPFVPIVLAGTWAGARLSKSVPIRLFTWITDIFLICVGLYLLVGNLW